MSEETPITKKRGRPKGGKNKEASPTSKHTEIQIQGNNDELNLYEESFCRYLVEDNYSPLEAYKRAYNPDDDANSRSIANNIMHLFQKSVVKDRIKQLERMRVTRMQITSDDIIVEAWNNALEARKVKDFSAAARHLDLVGKWLGMNVEKHELDVKVSVDELAKVVGQREGDRLIEGEYRELPSPEDVERDKEPDRYEDDLDWFRGNYAKVLEEEYNPQKKRQKALWEKKKKEQGNSD